MDQTAPSQEPTAAELATLPVGTPLPPEQDGAPRYVCRCHLVRDRRVFGRGSLRALWCGPIALGIGAAVVVFVAVLAVAPQLGLWRVLPAGLLVALVVGSAYAGRSGGHRGWCAVTRAAYVLFALPAGVAAAANI
jgi:hypothetical protein